VLALKRRPIEKGLIVIGATAQAFAPELNALAPELASRISAGWPGAITWVVPNVRFPKWITGQHETIAIRVPAHAQALRLCAAVGKPVVSTSANPAGRNPARTALAVRRYFGRALDFVLEGTLGDRRGPSEIRNAATNEALRTR
jgi:L-threonylcarbamoyladenylate synthase